jgi:hypothetical protein
MSVPSFPEFIPITLDQKDDLHPRLSLTTDGVSEFTFSGLYLFRNKYNYRISRNVEGESGYLISGEQGGKRFFMTPCCVPGKETLDGLFKTHDYWKNISDSILTSVKEKFENSGIAFTEDRDNFDYLYNRSDLAELPGKKFHKKKNHVNQFLHAYPEHEQRPMTDELIPAAMEIVDRWREAKEAAGFFNSSEEAEYAASKEALGLFADLPLRGSIFYVDGKPAAYCLGESIARGRMFVIHYEKAVESYKGIYQYMNQAFASALPRFFTLINREQDLGNEGLRQAKMTYRPCGFVQKFRGSRE